MTRYAPALDLLKKKEARILFLTDLHYPICDRAFIQRQLKKEWDLIIFGGDITEGTVFRSPGASLTSGSEKQALEMFEKDLDLVPAGTRMELVLGNHDTRASRMSGQDIVAVEKICIYKNIQLSENHTIIPVRIYQKHGRPGQARSVFKICVTHGHGGGATEQAPLNAMKRVREAIDGTCDLYLCGHFHQYSVDAYDFRGSTMAASGKLQPTCQPQLFIACGSPIRWEGSYAEGTSKSRPYKSTSVKGLEIILKASITNNKGLHGYEKSIQHNALYE